MAKLVLALLISLICGNLSYAVDQEVRCTRYYPCFLNPCRVKTCDEPSGLVCRPDYCEPGCGRRYFNEEMKEVKCEREKNRPPSRNRMQNFQ